MILDELLDRLREGGTVIQAGQLTHWRGTELETPIEIGLDPSAIDAYAAGLGPDRIWGGVRQDEFAVRLLLVHFEEAIAVGGTELRVEVGQGLVWRPREIEPPHLPPGEYEWVANPRSVGRRT